MQTSERDKSWAGPTGGGSRPQRNEPVARAASHTRHERYGIGLGWAVARVVRFRASLRSGPRR